jgi:RNA polymerase sigma-70 factor (ECF subfamily)
MINGTEARQAPDPQLLNGYSAQLHRRGRAHCRSQHEAEDLVQHALLARSRDPSIGTRQRARLPVASTAQRAHHPPSRRRPTAPVPITEAVAGASDQSAVVGPRDLMAAIAAAAKRYRDAVVAIDVLGLSYKEAA